MLQSGCLYVIGDAFDVFVIEATVVSESGVPIEGARVHFVDSSLDHWRRGKFESAVLGASDRSGEIRIAYEYTWATKSRGKKPKPIERDLVFSIVFRADGYQALDRRIDYRTLTERDRRSVFVRLGEVVLLPDAESSATR